MKLTSMRMLGSGAGLILLLWVGPLHAQTIFVSDSFTVAANTSLDAHTPNVGGKWTRFIGAGVLINAATDDARNAAGGDWNIYTDATLPPAGAAEVVVGETVTFTNNNTNNFVNLIARGSAALVNGYVAQLRASNDGTGTNVQIIAYIGGAPTTLASASVPMTLNVAHFFLFSVKNASKEIWIDGVLAVSSNTNGLAASGLVGLGMQSNVAGQTKVDDYFAATFAPTAVAMRSMAATRDGENCLVEWTTGYEAHNLGFLLWRKSKGRMELLTPSIVAGSAFMVPGAPLRASNTYRWLDRKTDGVYWIEELDLDGGRRWHGPIAGRVGPVDLSTMTSAPTLQSLSSTMSSLPAARAEGAGGRRHSVGAPSGLALAKQFELAGQPAVKIAVIRAGLHRVTGPQLVSAAMDLKLDPRTLQMYEDGVEIPILVEGESAGRIDGIVFYGRPLDTPFTGTRIYWLIAGGSRGLRIPVIPPAVAPPLVASSFPALVERSDKTLYAAAVLGPDVVSDGFYGPIISTDPGSPTSYSITVRHLDSRGDAVLEVSLHGVNDEALSGGVHRVALTLNGHPLADLTFSGPAQTSARYVIPASWLAEGANELKFATTNGPADVALIETARITYPHTYQADDDQLFMTAQSDARVTVRGFSTPDVRVVDITRPGSPVELTVVPESDGAITFAARGGGLRSLLAVAGSALIQPLRVEGHAPTSLHNSAGADILMITPRAFAAALEPLRQLRVAQGHSVMVAFIDDIYDEFNFGAKDPAAIPLFLARTRSWSVPARFVLLLGDASYDPRNYLGKGDFDFIPTKFIVADQLRTASDSWLADFDGDGVADIPIGRMPVRTLGEARIEVGKVVSYEKTAAGQPWTKEVVLVVDNDPAIRFDQSASTIRSQVPAAFNVSEIDVASAGVPAAHELLMRQLNAGALLVDYIGHGSTEIWTSQGLFDSADAASLTNGDRLPMVVATTCLNGYFQDVVRDSLAETLLKTPGGGAVAVWASSALTDSNQQSIASRELIRQLLGGRTIGEATVAAQRSATDPNVRSTFLLFGDPAMHLVALP